MNVSKKSKRRVFTPEISQSRMLLPRPLLAVGPTNGSFFSSRILPGSASFVEEAGPTAGLAIASPQQKVNRSKNTASKTFVLSRSKQKHLPRDYLHSKTLKFGQPQKSLGIFLRNSRSTWGYNPQIRRSRIFFCHTFLSNISTLITFAKHFQASAEARCKLRSGSTPAHQWGI